MATWMHARGCMLLLPLPRSPTDPPSRGAAASLPVPITLMWPFSSGNRHVPSLTLPHAYETVNEEA